MSVLDIYGCGKPFRRKKMDFGRAYQSWYALLVNKCMNLFEWEGLPFPSHELEFRAQIMSGYTGVVRSKTYNRLVVANGSGVGVTEYPDQWLTYVWAIPGDSSQSKVANKKTPPKESGITHIGVDCVLVRNNSLLIPTKFLIERYAHLLAHAELSLQAILINSRATGIIAARDENQKDDIKHFYDALEDGRTLAIVDDQGLDTLVGSEGLRSVSTAYPASTNIKDFWQIRQNLYKEFLTEIGISKSTDKRERLITSEVEQDAPLYGYSLDDMLRCRQNAAEEMNQIFGLNVSVRINPIIEQLREGGDRGETEGEV